MRPSLGLLSLLVTLACYPTVAQPRLPLESRVGPPPQLTEREYIRLQPLHARAMLRGYCFAQSAIADTSALGGFAQWGNVPRKFTSEIDAPRGTIALLARPEERTIFAERYRGMRFYIANTTDSVVAFRASDSRLYVIQEALDEHGDWRFIEYLQSSFCGNSYHTLFLRPGEFWSFDAPRYHGSFRTRLRFRLMTETYPVERSLYSNEFDGSINPEQFTELQAYGRGGIMDPYTSIRPSGLRYGLIDRDGGVLIAPRFEEMFPAGEHFAVKVDGHWGFIDRAGRTLVEPRFDRVGMLRDGLAEVNFGARLDWTGDVGGGLWGLVDLDDSLVVVPAYDRIEDFRCGVAAVSVGDCSGLIDRNGQIIIPLEYDDVSLAHDAWRDPGPIDAVCPAYVIVRKGAVTDTMRIDGGAERFIDTTGKVLDAGPAPGVSLFEGHVDSDSRTRTFQRNDRWGLMDSARRVLIEPTWSAPIEVTEDRAIVFDGERFGVVTTTGSEIVAPRYRRIKPYHRGTAIVAVDKEAVEE